MWEAAQTREHEESVKRAKKREDWRGRGRGRERSEEEREARTESEEKKKEEKDTELHQLNELRLSCESCD